MSVVSASHDRREPIQEGRRRQQLQHVWWIGGGSGAGKSTVAARLAAQHGLRRYGTDEVMADHADRCAPEDCPHLRRFTAMDMDERWVDRSAQTMLETFHWFRGEGFDLIVDDLLHLPTRPGVIVEGFRLLPPLVAPLLADVGRAVWLLPTPGFRRAAFDRRGSTWDIAGRTSDPDTALRNLLDRDRLFTDRLREEARSLGLNAVEVGTTTTEDDLAGRVAVILGL